MAQSDRSNSIWHNDIISTWHSWLVLSCIGSQWARCSTFKYLANACCSSSSALQKPSTFPSSTCIDLLWGDHVCYGGYSWVICAAAVFLTCSQQHVVDVLAVARYLLCCSSRSVPPRPNTLTLSCTLPCKSLRELSWQNLFCHNYCQRLFTQKWNHNLLTTMTAVEHKRRYFEQCLSVFVHTIEGHQKKKKKLCLQTFFKIYFVFQRIKKIIHKWWWNL